MFCSSSRAMYLLRSLSLLCWALKFPRKLCPPSSNSSLLPSLSSSTSASSSCGESFRISPCMEPNESSPRVFKSSYPNRLGVAAGEGEGEANGVTRGVNLGVFTGDSSGARIPCLL
eukprot:scaffold1190_cov393-Prasinococcus_capsulatus_cf.AAC.50